ncbi:MAG: hypothetical protein IJU62_02440 [Muribaculaceae bacterium]|nr:hypothetical protein [Muribaculaceae bacterium]
MGTYRQTIYCDIGFLESILSMQGTKMHCTGPLFCTDNEIAANVRQLLISKDVKLYLNISQEEYDDIFRGIENKRKEAIRDDRDPEITSFEEQMLDIDRKRQEGLLHLHVNAEKVNLDETLNQDKFLNAIFFSCESKAVCEKAMDEFGIIVICIENINDFKHLIFDHGIALHRREEADWYQCLSKHGVANPCNSLVIVDNYLLNDSASIEENLSKILDAILPKHLSNALTFQITLFTTLCNDRGIPYDSNRRFNQVKDIIERLRPEINFSLCIVKCSRDKFHDRTIATNNIYIGCGGGFDLFKRGKAQKTTTVCAFHPFFYNHSNWSHKAYSDFLNDACKVFKESMPFDESRMNNSFPNFTIGEKQNRLLNQAE